MPPHVYILDDDPVFAQLLKANLGRVGEFRIQLFQDPLECLEVMSERPPDALVSDLRMPDMSGVEVAARVREQSSHLPIFLLTAHGDIDTAIDALKAGANEYLLKPVNVTELTTLLRKALAERPLLEEASSRRAQQKTAYAVDAFLGEHPLAQEVRDFVRGVSEVPGVSVLLLGESGVGKNLVARTIHYADEEATGSFVEVNCAALPETLLEAELFGYVKGAFTDARESKQGLVEAADGGTLFLDEIGEMPLGLQAKLLNFLESRRFRRLGATRELEVSLRLVTATNRELEALVERGDFREDLFYRVAVARHTLPALRDMASDVPLLVDHFVRRFAEDFGKEITGASDEALEALQALDWPGNVRELRNVIERAMIFAKGPLIERSDLPSLGTAVRIGGGSPDGFHIPRDLTLEEAEKEYIRLTMEAHDGTVQEAAEGLGISRKNLWEKRKKHGLLD